MEEIVAEATLAMLEIALLRRAQIDARIAWIEYEIRKAEDSA